MARTLTKAEVTRLFKDTAGAERVSRDAEELLLNVAYELAREIAFSAVEFSRDNGKKTVNESHVRDAVKKVLGAKEDG